MTSKNTSRLYVVSVIVLGIIVPFVSLFSLNLLADPYAIWGMTISDHNKNRPTFISNVRMMKAYAVRRLRPEHIVIGTSRSMPLDPEHPAWPEGRCYNLALPGGKVEELWAYLRHAQSVHPLKTVVFGMDFLEFNAIHSPPLTFQEDILAYEDRRLGWLILAVKLTASLQTAEKSLRVLNLTGTAPRSSLYPNGRRNPELLREKVELSGGHRQMFYENGRNYVWSLGGLDIHGRTYGYLLDNGHGLSTMRLFTDIVRFCQDEGIQLHMFISPSHAFHWEMLNAVGFWPQFEEWKRSLVEINENIAAEQGAKAFTIWDFSGYNTITSEPVPPEEVKGVTMEYYWEASHYNGRTADLVLDTVLAGRTTPGFGRRLTGDTIEHTLAAIRDEQSAWQARFPEERQSLLNALGRINPVDGKK